MVDKKIIEIKTLTRFEIIDKIRISLGVSRSFATQLVEDTLDTMCEGIVNDGVLKLSSFGTFFIREKNARVGRNPKTKKEHTISPRTTISFKSSTYLVKKVNKRPQDKAS